MKGFIHITTDITKAQEKFTEESNGTQHFVCSVQHKGKLKNYGVTTNDANYHYNKTRIRLLINTLKKL